MISGPSEWKSDNFAYSPLSILMRELSIFLANKISTEKNSSDKASNVFIKNFILLFLYIKNQYGKFKQIADIDKMFWLYTVILFGS